MRRLALVALVLVVGCSKKQPTGLAPAQDWGAAQQGRSGDEGAVGNNPHARDPDNPHAGLGLNAEGQPEDDDGTANPHAGLNMSGGVDVTKMGLPPPDPNRPIDPHRYVKGEITVDAKSADRLKPGSVVYVVIKHADASGQPTGTPLAVDKLSWQTGGLPFELGDAQAMVGGTELVGDVVVEAHYAQNGDAMSRAAGDMTGQTRVTIPADHVKVVLDKVL